MNLQLKTTPLVAFSSYLKDRLAEIKHRLEVNKVERELLERERDALRQKCPHPKVITESERNIRHCPDCGWSSDF